jgi:hypothetical protein
MAMMFCWWIWIFGVDVKILNNLSQAFIIGNLPKILNSCNKDF